MNAYDFLAQMMAGLDRIMPKLKGLDRYPANTLEGCIKIYESCLEFAPVRAVDIGTSYGASCLSIALALQELGVPLSNLTTVCWSQKRWPTIQKTHKAILRKTGLPIHEIQKVADDFKKVKPEEIYSEEDRVFIFYDVHDFAKKKDGKLKRERRCSTKFITKWIPHIDVGRVFLHDMLEERTPVFDKVYYESSDTLWDGRKYWGYAECEKFVQWLNVYKASVIGIPEASAIQFDIEDGKPL